MSHVKISTNTSFHPVSLPSWCETSTKATSMRHNHYFCVLEPYWREQLLCHPCSSGFWPDAPAPLHPEAAASLRIHGVTGTYVGMENEFWSNTHWWITMVISRLELKETKTFSLTFSGENGTSALWSLGQDFLEKRQGTGWRHWSQALSSWCSPWARVPTGGGTAGSRQEGTGSVWEISLNS